METFEIHITGSYGINQEFDRLGIKNIIVDLLKPNKRILRTEYMSSFISKHTNLTECKKYVKSILPNIASDVIRVKIESPYYEHYKAKALYLESHFKPIDTLYPISQNNRTGKLMATDRTYNKKEYKAFIDKWKDEDVEMCLVDSFVEEDADWFELYLQKDLELSK
jgi:hypothetical protein